MSQSFRQGSLGRAAMITTVLALSLVSCANKSAERLDLLRLEPVLSIQLDDVELDTLFETEGNVDGLKPTPSKMTRLLSLESRHFPRTIEQIRDQSLLDDWVGHENRSGGFRATKQINGRPGVLVVGSSQFDSELWIDLLLT